MKKDIEIPKVKAVYIALIQERNDDFLEKTWNAYLINDGSLPVELVFVVSKGYDGDLKTATMRHHMEALEAKSYQKLEFVHKEVLDLTNEFYVTYYLHGQLYEKRFVFEKGSISEENLTQIPLLEIKGVLAS
ncbi:MAG: hypothetical protein WBM98_11525 [Maribacter sp.]|uniref:hypothetical protein n=1 Tax=Maribacter sp. TaxID=1897614 RepID=UPI003C746CA4